MKIHLIAAGQRMPAWVNEAYREYARRLPPECALELTEIPLGSRGRDDARRAVEDEGRRILAAVPRQARIIALDAGGQASTTEQLAERLDQWLMEGVPPALLIGGPDGLAAGCLERAEWRWSLSRLTLPHALVRVIVAEQLYRAWTLRQGHPYHR